MKAAAGSMEALISSKVFVPPNSMALLGHTSKGKDLPYELYSVS